MKPLYTIHVVKHGVLLCSPPGQTGVPLHAPTRVIALFSDSKKAVIATSVTQYYREVLKIPAVMAISESSKVAEEWKADIDAELARTVVDPELRWYNGTDTGMSSKAIFAVLSKARPYVKEDRGEVPYDSADFGRCLRLVNQMPGWKERLPEVAAAYPETTWPAIIARWDVLAASAPRLQTKLLSEINHPKTTTP